ncbi:hypothetical protein ASPWEDRAFT_120507 [Aspergillus wentii DTO 134E9]|uniref:Rhodopsin domain-containing protein n=1 Tax=Aspergillus wentii DTO 134E9 TaxID=1073089 RepID=A0A1L9R585_ASPWE|nr:uncharacterized protein ASPWEDRAFT_120507 [Aspergillus wentii DTO 134E9]KAI9923726.1 hypothetical protein MW887_008353 [Aspergillus wentii]OJJ30079.1 hypothetical protein ASPWEDRAFT_120507 [Aspergillus wentii DTO 134E9]
MSINAVFGSPPSGIDLSDNLTPRNNATVIAVYILAVCLVALRFVARIKAQGSTIATDDWLIVGAVVSVTANVVCTIEAGQHGQGKHVWSLTLQDVSDMMKVLYANVLLYVVTVPLTKLSIIFFYRRIFGMHWILWVCFFLTTGYWFSCTITFLVACTPPSYYWSQYLDPTGGKCRFPFYPFYVGNAAANVVTDGIILIVPIRVVWQLQMRTAQKWMVTGIFLLGGFVVIASIIRIYYMTFLKSSLDITWIMGSVFVWSSIEPCIGIVCACLPTLQPLLRHALTYIVNSTRSKRSNAAGESSGKRPSGPSASEGVDSVPNMDRNHRKGRRIQHPLWRDVDEAGLTTSSTFVEMDSLGRNASSDGEGSEGSQMGIRVKSDFHWTEEHPQHV